VAGLDEDHRDAPCPLRHVDVYEMNEIGLVRLRPRLFRRVINTSIERPSDLSARFSRRLRVLACVCRVTPDRSHKTARTPRKVTTYGNGGPILALEGTAICFADTPWLSPSTMREPCVRGVASSHIERKKHRTDKPERVVFRLPLALINRFGPHVSVAGNARHRRGTVAGFGPEGPKERASILRLVE